MHRDQRKKEWGWVWREVSSVPFEAQGKGETLRNPSSLRAGRLNMDDGSRSSYRLSIVFLITELAFERCWRKLKDSKGLGGAD